MPAAASLDPYLETAVLAADRARSVTRAWFRRGFEVNSKADRTPVTAADREAELVIRKTILERHPDHGFFGEETEPSGAGADRQWVIDPIDGTKSFATGAPIFGTLVTLLEAGRPVLGIIDHAALDERWIGVRGRPSTHNGAPCTARPTTDLAAASLRVTSADMFGPANGPRCERLAARCAFRAFGGDCYNYGLLASGHTDLVCEADLKPYDFLALVPVVEGAGGVITDWQGAPLTMDSTGEVLAAANAALHRAALAVLDE